MDDLVLSILLEQLYTYSSIIFYFNIKTRLMNILMILFYIKVISHLIRSTFSSELLTNNSTYGRFRNQTVYEFKTIHLGLQFLFSIYICYQ